MRRTLLVEPTHTGFADADSVHAVQAVSYFGTGSPLITQAYEFARRAHAELNSEGPRIEHPVEVARILQRHGFGDDVVAAGLLHDIVEHTDHSLTEIERRFGPSVGGLVDAMTEDGSIDDYEERKAAHRARLARLDDRAAAIFAADKLAKVRELARTGERPATPKLDHYLESVRMLRQAHPHVPMLDDLEAALHGLLSGVAR
jgi:(p)ppGpp synthase/HD superfamily hydrolase